MNLGKEPTNVLIRLPTDLLRVADIAAAAVRATGGAMIGITSPLDLEGQALVPGGRPALTRFAVEFLDRLLFGREAGAQILAEEYLALHRNPLGERAAVIFGHVQRWAYEGVPGAAISCFDCGATGLEHWYTSRQGGYHLCPTCFEGRQSAGRAKEV